MTPDKTTNRVPVLLDTDPGTDIDDVVALAYFLRQPRCDLLGVTTVSGDTPKRASIVDFVLRSAGRPTVPVHAGSPGPLLMGPGQPEVPQYVAVQGKGQRTPDQFPRGTAVEFLRHTIRSRPGEITLLTIGPLTNIALLFSIDPEIPSLLKQVVTMGGHFFPPSGMDKWAEWNIHCDPTAAQIFYATRLSRHTSFGLDVTTKCTLDTADVKSKFATRPILRDLLDMADVWFKNQPRMTFHDPLAAASIFHPELCTYSAGQIHLEPSHDWQHAARTYFVQSEDSTGPHSVARTVSPSAFFDRYFEVF
jgi:purine nucleosidase